MALEIPEKLRSQRRLFSIIQSLPLSFLLINKNGYIVNANHKALALFGHSSVKNLKSQKFMFLFSDGVRESLKAAFDQAITCSKNKPITLDRIETSGPQGAMILNAYFETVVDDDLYVLLALSDLTETEKARANFERTSEYLNSILETMAEGVVVMDKEGKIKGANDSFCNLFQQDKNQCVDRNIKDYIPAFYKFAETVSSTKNIKSEKEALGQRQDGSSFPISLSLTQINAHNGLNLCGLVRDISAQKDYENRLKYKNQELTRLNEDLEQFVYMVSHDLQEPLRAINSYFQLLNHKFLSIKDEGKDIYIKNIKGSIERMRALIHGVLAYSQIDMMSSIKNYINVNNLIEDAQSLFRNPDQKKEIVFVTESLQSVKGYPPLILMLFQNLISNAIKYNSNDKVIIKIASEIWSQDDQMLLYKVQDNGIGIDPAHQEKVFKMFQRLHHNREYEGLGVGLASCKKIVQLHEGQIWFESEIGQGTTFYFTLPSAEKTNEQKKLSHTFLGKR